MTDVWGEFAESPNYDNMGCYNVAQSLSNSSFFLDGVSFQQLMIVRSGNKNVVPLKIKQIPAQLHAMFAGLLEPASDGTTVINGIKFDKTGRPISYFFHKSFIENQVTNLSGIFDPSIFVEVPVEDMVHYFHRDYAGQWLGVPQLTPVLLALYELDDFISATVQKQKVAQAISLVISQTQQALSSTGRVSVGDVEGVTNSETGEAKYVFKTVGTNVLDLPYGSQAQLLQSSDVGNNWETLVRTELRKVAAISNILYHELTGDTAELSFSAINALLLQSRTRLEYLAMTETIPLRERKIANRFKEIALLYDTEKTAKKQAVNAVPVFKLPKYRSLDPLKDTQAAILALQNNIGLWQDALTEAGISIEEWLSDKDLQKLHDVTFQEQATSMQQASNTQANSNSVGN
jgi:capsid protein